MSTPTITIFDRYYQLLAEWKKDSALDDVHNHLPLLIIAEFIADRLTTESNRIVDALRQRTDR